MILFFFLPSFLFPFVSIVSKFANDREYGFADENRSTANCVQLTTSIIDPPEAVQAVSKRLLESLRARIQVTDPVVRSSLPIFVPLTIRDLATNQFRRFRDILLAYILSGRCYWCIELLHFGTFCRFALIPSLFFLFLFFLSLSFFFW